MKRKPIVYGIIRSLLPLRILDLLRSEPLHGLEISERIGAETGGAWKPSAGTLYPILQRMEKDGLIQGRWERSKGAPRRVFTLTDRGRSAHVDLRREVVEELELAQHLIATHLDALRTRTAPAAGSHLHLAEHPGHVRALREAEADDRGGAD